MTENNTLLSSPVTIERLSWIEECVKFFSVQLYPETLMHQAPHGQPVFSFLLTEDALYSLDDPETRRGWEIILSLPAIQIICDREEMDLRGLSATHLKMKFPDQVFVTNRAGPDGKPSFWNEVIAFTRGTGQAAGRTAGWLQYESPYMYCSALQGTRFLTSAQGERMSIEMYTCLDGIYTGHSGQSPADMENLGEMIEILSAHAQKNKLSFLALACNSDAATRGLCSPVDPQGNAVSNCMINAFRIVGLKELIGRFRLNHVILSPDSCAIMIRKDSELSFDRAEKSTTAPPITILITKSPYDNGIVTGAVEFAITCAREGILSRVIFIEDGIYALSGIHRPGNVLVRKTIQERINSVAGSENLHFFAHLPSFQKRGVAKEKSLNAVLDIGHPGLAKIFFFPPSNVNADHQRIIIF
jgi:tRNA 2-thiouridine synthesizing protein C